MNLPHRFEMAASVALAKLGRRAYDDEGALSTEMMLLAAIVTIVAIAGGVLLMQSMNNAAGNIQTDPGNLGGNGGGNP